MNHPKDSTLPIYHQMASLPKSTEHRCTSCDDPAMGAETTAPSLQIRSATGWACGSCSFELMFVDGPRNPRRRMRCPNHGCPSYDVMVWEPVFQAERA